MQTIGSIIALLRVMFLFVGYSNGIRVHEDTTEKEPTTSAATTTTTIATQINPVSSVINTFDNLSNATSSNLSTHNTTSHLTAQTPFIIRNVTVHTNDKTGSSKPGIFGPNGGRNKINSKFPLNDGRGNHRSNQRTKSNTQHKFIPSPELIVDSSQSSESHERFVINSQPHVIPFPTPNDNTRNILSSNQSEKLNKVQYISSTTSSDAIHHGSVLAENDKLPWPIPYEKAEKEFKWKTIRPETKSYKPDYNISDQTINLGGNKNFEQQESETTSIASSIPTNHPQFSTVLPSYHPYELESIHTWPTNPTHEQSQTSDYSTIQHDDAYAQPIDRLNETKSEYTQAKDSLIPVERINKNVLWHTALKWLATAIPIGLVISAFAPNIVIVDANSTTPYPPLIYPTPYASYMQPTPQRPLSIYGGVRGRIQQVTPDKQNYLQFLEKASKLRGVGSHSGANSCENRYLCELGLAAVNDHSDTQSAHALYGSLWRISANFRDLKHDEKSMDDMNSIFTSIQKRNCTNFPCSLK